jgi:SAM-dependent methyltransferase
MTVVFDPEHYKRTTRTQWEEAARAWHAWGPSLEGWLGEATAAMLDAARVTAGSRVLDVAAGAGGQSLAAARRGAQVLATDISPAILAHAAADAARAGLPVTTRELDGEELDVEPGEFDAVISRLGLIYLPDRQRALAGVYRALAPGGRVAAIVYSTAERNAFFAVPVSIIRRRAALPPPAPGQPGPFSLGAPGALAEELRVAGFRDVGSRTLDAPVRMPSAAECVRFERESFGALHQMLAGLDPQEREDAWEEITAELSRFEEADGFAGPCELVVAWGTK